jgi:hypothetical protein
LFDVPASHKSSCVAGSFWSEDDVASVRHIEPQVTDAKAGGGAVQGSGKDLLRGSVQRDGGRPALQTRDVIVEKEFVEACLQVPRTGTMSVQSDRPSLCEKCRNGVFAGRTRPIGRPILFSHLPHKFAELSS